MEPKFRGTMQYSEHMLEKVHYTMYKLRSEKKVRISLLIVMVCVLVFININLKNVMELKVGWLILILLNITLIVTGALLIVKKTTAYEIAKIQTKNTIRNMKDPFQKVEYQFFEEYYIVETPVSKTEYKYDSIMDIVETEELFFLFLGKTTLLGLEKRYLNKSIEEFRNFIEKKLKAIE